MNSQLLCVMLIDDNETDNFIAKRIIEVTGFAQKVIVTCSATQALGYLNTYQLQPDLLPEIIFLDINMPVNNGFDFLDKFDLLSHTIKDKCKIIILSSSDYKTDIERIIENHYVMKFITKPITETELEEIRFVPA